MRIAIGVAVFVVVFAAGLLALPTVPAAGQTVPPPTATPRPTASVSPTPDPGCTDDCGPIPTPRPIMGTPGPGCEGECFPWPTPRPTYIPGGTIDPAEPGPGKQIWFYGFMPIVGRQ